MNGYVFAGTGQTWMVLTHVYPMAAGLTQKGLGKIITYAIAVKALLINQLSKLHGVAANERYQTINVLLD